jgi:nitroreductase
MQIKNTIEAIHARYSCRAFSDEMPSDADLQTIAEAAVAAPSALNSQLWRVIVVKNKELLARLETEGMKNIAALPDKGTYERLKSRGGTLYYNAPCQIILPIAAGEGAEVATGKWVEIDCGIIAQNIALAAASLGINSLICGLAQYSFAGEKSGYFKEKLGFPKGYELGLSVLLGYAMNPDGKPHELDLNKISIFE